MKKQITQTQSTTCKEVTFNLVMYKYHALADYVDIIRKYGTTDSYSTELVRVLCQNISTVEC